MSELERLRKEYDAAVKRRHGKIGATGLEIRADALITALEAEVERANELCIRDLEHTEKRAEQAEAEVALRDRMLRDIIERIALTPERWNGWTTEEVLADLRARAEKEAADA